MKRTLIVLVLAALGLGAAAPTTALTAPEPAASPWEEVELEVEEEDWELGELEEECFEEDAELEALCEEELEEAQPCPLRSARAHAATRHKRLKITVGYMTYEPTAARVQILRVGTFKRHLGRSGVLRFTTKKRLRKVVVLVRTPERSDCPPQRLVALSR